MTDGGDPSEKASNDALDVRPRRTALSPDMLGFACGIGLLLSSLSLLLHWYELRTPAAAATARAIGALTLFVAPIFPWLALASPEPANGPKLLVFPAALMLALTPWLPSSWFVKYGSGAIVSVILMFAIAGNLLAPFVPAGGRANNLYKRIRWDAGGKLMWLVGGMGIALAAADAILTGSARSYRFASIALFPVFAFFVQTRFMTAPKAILTGLVAALALGALYRGFEERDLTGSMLAFGALYCSTHVARSAGTLWTLLASILAAGSARTAPHLAPGLLLGVMILTFSAMQKKQWIALPFCVMVLLACGGAMQIALQHRWSRTAPLNPWSLGIVSTTNVVAILAVLTGFAGMVRFRTPPAARALFWVSAAWVLTPFFITRFHGDLTVIPFMGFALLAGGLVARRDEGVHWTSSESGSFA